LKQTFELFKFYLPALPCTHFSGQILFRSIRGYLATIAGLLGILISTAYASATGIEQSGRIASGWQFDAAIDEQGIIHLISDRYYRFNTAGNLLSSETQAQDLQQSGLSFSPAISIDPAGNAHILTRGAGSVIDGVEIRYQIRKTNGDWQYNTQNYLLGTPEKRNYVVGIAAVSETEAYATSSVGGSNVWGDIRFWELGTPPALQSGDWSGIWRADLDTRMRSRNGMIYFASANAFTRNNIVFSMAPAGPDLFGRLQDNAQIHDQGSSYRGNPDIAVDPSGAAHLIYGAYQEIFYNRYDADGQPAFSSDRRILSKLGNWHLSFGMGSIGVLDDGETIMVLGQKSNGNKFAQNTELMLTFSLDGGRNWQAPIATGVITHGGEGRMRPRILNQGDRFIIIYFDAKLGGISLASIAKDTLETLKSNTLFLPVISLLLLD